MLKDRAEGALFYRLTFDSKNQQTGCRRARRILVWLGTGAFLFMFLALHVMAGMFSKYDNPNRLGAEIHVTTASGFTLRWAIHRVANADCNLVFVHGSPGGAGVWQAQFVNPFPGANLIAYDRPGFGGSGPAQGQPHLQEQVEALMTLLDHITTNQVLLVGHSYGSPICLLAALEHPDRIGGVLLIGGDVDPAKENPMWIEYLVGWRLDSWLLPRSLRQCNREMLTIRGDLEIMQRKLPNLSVPVVMLHGARDPLVPVENVAWLQGQLDTVGEKELFTSIVHPEYNHFIPWEHPDAVAAAIAVLKQKVQTKPKSVFSGS